MATPEARANFPMIRYLDWEILGYVGNRAVRRPVGLADGIHDLFKWTVPRRSEPIWFDCTRREYAKMQRTMNPVFQLATNFLLCPASLDWFYHLIFAERCLTSPVVYHNGQPVWEYCRDDTPMYIKHWKAVGALERLARVHGFCFGEFKEDPDHEAHTSPWARRGPYGVNIRSDVELSFSGVDSCITIDDLFRERFWDIAKNEHHDSSLLYNLRTKLALTLVHEICHAASMASSIRLLRDVQAEVRYRDISDQRDLGREDEENNINEDLFEYENLAEAGYSWENAVFGGGVDLLHLDPANPLTFAKWPNFLKGDRDLREGGLKRTATEYIVPWAWVVNVNTQSWWHTVRRDDNTALHIKKLVGIRRECSSPNVDQDWDSDYSSEGEWQTDEQRCGGRTKSKRVSRMRHNSTVEDPSGAMASEWANWRMVLPVSRRRWSRPRAWLSRLSCWPK